jgi:hypothetical protein
MRHTRRGVPQPGRLQTRTDGMQSLILDSRYLSARVRREKKPVW